MNLLSMKCIPLYIKQYVCNQIGDQRGSALSKALLNKDKLTSLILGLAK